MAADALVRTALVRCGVPDAPVWHDGATWRDAARTFAVVDPGSGNDVARAAAVGVADLTGLSAWLDASARRLRALAPRDRAGTLQELAARLGEHRTQVARVIAIETGKPQAEAVAEVDYAQRYCEWFSHIAMTDHGTQRQAPDGRHRLVLTHVPVGGAVLITPWNLPIALAVRKIAAAVAAGCPWVLKPAEQSPLSALTLGALATGLSASAGAVLPTDRPGELVEALLGLSAVHKVSFTGSTEVGGVIAAAAARHHLRCSLELGGDAPAVVLSDADVESAAAAVVAAKARNAGQTCIAPNRVLVVRDRADELLAALRSRLAALRPGTCFDPQADLGPVIDEHALTRLRRWTADAARRGAVVEELAAVPGAGFFCPPTLVTGLSADDPLLRHELFGPVMAVAEVDDDDHAVAAATSARGGLAGYVFTRDVSRGLAIAERLGIPLMGVNHGTLSEPAAPFGGAGRSGVGKEGGLEGVREYQELVCTSLAMPAVQAVAA